MPRTNNSAPPSIADRLVERLTKLVRTPSENPPGDEAAAGAVTESYCRTSASTLRFTRPSRAVLTSSQGRATGAVRSSPTAATSTSCPRATRRCGSGTVFGPRRRRRDARAGERRREGALRSGSGGRRTSCSTRAPSSTGRWSLRSSRTRKRWTSREPVGWSSRASSVPICHDRRGADLAPIGARPTRSELDPAHDARAGGPRFGPRARPQRNQLHERGRESPRCHRSRHHPRGAWRAEPQRRDDHRRREGQHHPCIVQRRDRPAKHPRRDARGPDSSVGVCGRARQDTLSGADRNRRVDVRRTCHSRWTRRASW